jgi:hypothetical protein
MTAATDDPTGIPIPKTSTYITERQVQEMKSEISGIEGMLADPKARIEDRGGMVQVLRRMKNDLEREAPPDTTPDQRTALSNEERALREKMLEGFPSQEEMRKNPPGAVGKHQAWEKANKSRLIRWKNIMRTLNKGNEDPDIANFERYRGTTSTLNMQNAQIPGKDYFIPPNSPQYREGYDRTFGGDVVADTSEVDALKARLAELEALVKKDNGRTTHTPHSTILNCPHCNRECKGKVGLIAHERNCKTRKAQAEQGDAA